MTIYLGLSIFVNVILIIYLAYLYLYKGELRENKNVEFAEVDTDCGQCLTEHKILLKDVENLKNDITHLRFTHTDLNEKAAIIRHGMDRLMQASTRSSITITP